MSIKKFYALLAVEVTTKNTVADFAMIIVDRKGAVVNSCSVLVRDHYQKYEFSNKDGGEIREGTELKEKKRAYEKLLKSGRRMIASTRAINSWLQRTYCEYHPELVAINLQFIVKCCQNTEVDLGVFVDQFSLGQAALGNICNTRAFQKFSANEHCADFSLFNDFTTRNFALLVASFISGGKKEEKLTAYEYLMDFDLPILIYVLNRKNWRTKMVPAIKELAEAGTVEKPAQKRIAEKLGKGYREVGVEIKPVAQPTETTKTEIPFMAKKPSAGSIEPSENERLASISDLVKAIEVGDADLVASILDRGFDPNTRFGFGREHGWSPLHLAVKSAYWEMSRHAFLKVLPMLFDATGKIWSFGRLKGGNEQEESLLKIVSVLLEKGSDPLAINGEGRTPFEVACEIEDSSWDKDLFSRLHTMLVPPSGSAPTLQGELLRIIGKLSHERFGNGWCNLIDGLYELKLDDLYDFFNGADAATVFSELELKCSRLAVSMAFLDTYVESGKRPKHSSKGKEAWRNKKAIRHAWESVRSERGGEAFSSDPFEAVEDFCIEYCRRQPPVSPPLNSIFEATLTSTPENIPPELLHGLSSQATEAWLDVMASVTSDQQVIDQFIKNMDMRMIDVLACNPHLKARNIDALARRNGVDELLASNSAVAAKKLDDWAKVDDPGVRKAVAKNPATPMPTLVSLSTDVDLEVQLAAKQEIGNRDGEVLEAVPRKEPVFCEDPGTRIRLALISNDILSFTRLANDSDLSESLSQLLKLVFAMPWPSERRLMFADLLLEKYTAASCEFVGPLIGSLLADLGTKGAEGGVEATKNMLLRLIVSGSSLDALSSEQQCELYDFHRKGRQDASEVLYALVEKAMPIRHQPWYCADEDGASFMEKAVIDGDIDLVSRVICSGRKAVDDAPGNAICIAIGKKKWKLLDLLLSDGPDRYATSSAIQNGINDACFPASGKPSSRSLDKLIKAYRKLESEEVVADMLFELICTAVSSGSAELVEELIRNGTPVNQEMENLLENVFEWEAKENDRIFMTLVDAGLDLNHAAADSYREKIQKFLKRAKRKVE